MVFVLLNIVGISSFGFIPEAPLNVLAARTITGLILLAPVSMFRKTYVSWVCWAYLKFVLLTTEFFFVSDAKKSVLHFKLRYCDQWEVMFSRGGNYYLDCLIGFILTHFIIIHFVSISFHFSSISRPLYFHNVSLLFRVLDLVEILIKKQPCNVLILVSTISFSKGQMERWMKEGNVEELQDRKNDTSRKTQRRIEVEKIVRTTRMESNYGEGLEE